MNNDFNGTTLIASTAAQSTQPINTAALALLRAALDGGGWIAVVGLQDGKPPLQTFYAPGEYEAACSEATRLYQSGRNAYFGTATFLNGKSRKAENAHAIKAIKADVDIAPADPKKYPSKKAAVAALVAFCEDKKLPIPVLVDSGGGVHAYWIVHEALTASEGKLYSSKFKAAMLSYGLKIDPTVTGDISRILRVPGTANFKLETPRPVKLVGEVHVIDTDEMLEHIDRIYSESGVDPVAVPADNKAGLLDDMELPAHLRGLQLDKLTFQLASGKPKSFALILQKCAQLADIKTNQATTEYGRWRSGLSIAAYCTDDSAIHDISREHPNYSSEETIRKAADIAAPHRCSTFAEQRPDLCVGCSHSGITSPIVLGAETGTLAENDFAEAVTLLKEVQARAAAGDVGAPLEPAVIDAWRTIKNNDSAEYQRLRAALKQANRNVSLSALDDAVAEEMRSEEKNTAGLLIGLARENCTLFHDADKEPYASFFQGSHRECWHLHSAGFREWISHQAYKAHGIAPNETVVATALGTLSGQAKFDGEELPVATRVAKYANDYYIDLCDEHWQAVRVTSSGWQLVSAPPVMFVRSGAMRPLPMPASGGRIEALWKFANIEPDDRLLVLAWIMEAYRPETPYPVLELCAEQGAAKSFTQSIIRELLDPNKANLRAKPKSIDDLFVSAKASHVTSLENLSYLAPDFQDALCALATGAGHAGRTLYTNDQETVFEVKRPTMMNGISIVATAQDLMDRTLLVNLPAITDRRTESELLQEFMQMKSKLFGALLDLFAGALSVLPTVKIDPVELPRMADFARLGEALFRHMGEPEGKFLATYHAKRKHGVSQIIDSNPVAAAAVAWLETNPAGFSGTVKDLHDKLMLLRSGGELWPRSLRGFGDSLRRAAPGLRTLGHTVTYLGHHRDGHRWQIG